MYCFIFSPWESLAFRTGGGDGRGHTLESPICLGRILRAYKLFLSSGVICTHPGQGPMNRAAPLEPVERLQPQPTSPRICLLLGRGVSLEGKPGLLQTSIPGVAMVRAHRARGSRPPARSPCALSTGQAPQVVWRERERKGRSAPRQAKSSRTSGSHLLPAPGHSLPIPSPLPTGGMTPQPERPCAHSRVGERAAARKRPGRQGHPRRGPPRVGGTSGAGRWGCGPTWGGRCGGGQSGWQGT